MTEPGDRIFQVDRKNPSRICVLRITVALSSPEGQSRRAGEWREEKENWHTSRQQVPPLMIRATPCARHVSHPTLM